MFTAKKKAVLKDFDGRRDNNLTVIRYMLAWMVIISHAFALQRVSGYSNPLQQLFQGSTSAGQLAVDGFFVVSGFLVTASFVNRGLLDYALSRALRVLPALIVCTLLTVFVLGPIVTNLSVSDYFSRDGTYSYLTNSVAVMLAKYRLPGVFVDNHSHTVNGSLWSIAYETRCYIVLGVLGSLGVFARPRIALLCMGCLAAVLWYSYISPQWLEMKPHHSSALLCFVLGVLTYLHRHLIRLDIRVALIAFVVLLVAFGESWYRWVYPPLWAYLLFYAAYRTRFLDIDRKLGDASYGIYIYAFPIQQLIVMYLPQATPYQNILFTTALVLPVAFLSWHFIEKPALGVKRRLLG